MDSTVSQDFHKIKKKQNINYDSILISLQIRCIIPYLNMLGQTFFFTVQKSEFVQDK